MGPSSSDTPNLDSFSLADELAEVADSTKWAGLPGVNDPGKIAEMANAIGYFSVEDLSGATVAEHGDISALLLGAKGGGAPEHCERFRNPEVFRGYG